MDVLRRRTHARRLKCGQHSRFQLDEVGGLAAREHVETVALVRCGEESRVQLGAACSSQTREQDADVGQNAAVHSRGGQWCRVRAYALSTLVSDITGTAEPVLATLYCDDALGTP